MTEKPTCKICGTTHRVVVRGNPNSQTYGCCASCAVTVRAVVDWVNTVPKPCFSGLQEEIFIAQKRRWKITADFEAVERRPAKAS